MVTDKKIIAICVATYKRPELLSNCLNSIGQITIPEGYVPIIIVVDNDSERSGETSFNEAIKNIDIESHYYVEADRGICSARNCLLEKSLVHKAEYIAFVDDDEFPHPTWLKNHLIAMDKFNADVVAGPVISTLNSEPPNKILTNNKFITGQTPRHVAAGNVLFKSKLTSKDGLWFDTKYNFTGGEDFNFFDRSSAKGHIHVLAADAIIYETIPQERTTNKYLFFRHFTGAINNVIQYKANNGIFATWIHFLLKAAGKTIGSIFSFANYLVTLNGHRLKISIIKLASATGYISGLLNIIIERYR